MSANVLALHRVMPAPRQNDVARSAPSSRELRARIASMYAEPLPCPFQLRDLVGSQPLTPQQ